LNLETCRLEVHSGLDQKLQYRRRAELELHEHIGLPGTRQRFAVKKLFA